jgi:hypothetical protein
LPYYRRAIPATFAAPLSALFQDTIARLL